MHRFYAPPDSFSGDKIELGPDETRHLRDVLRLGMGMRVSVFDGVGREFDVVIDAVGKRSTSLSVIAETAPQSPESGFAITLAAAMVSGEKYDLVIQKAVELGVVAFIPLHTLRCDIKLKDAPKRLERWRRIALEATKQCGRARIMEVVEPLAFTGLVTGTENAVLFSERGGTSLSDLSLAAGMTILIGPKGGWGDSELEAASSSGIEIITLGGRTLRAETAAIAITAIVQHRFGDLR